ncbi:MAG TPA: hypothetical protein VG452_00600, partial [Egibacteraceae bacterium]|nr:hypothetical protein [Egibacteraceae bacterium]
MVDAPQPAPPSLGLAGQQVGSDELERPTPAEPVAGFPHLSFAAAADQAHQPQTSDDVEAAAGG